MTGLILLTWTVVVPGQSVQVVTVPDQGFEGGYWHEYFLGMLTLALDQTVDTHGVYEIRRSELVMAQQDRALRSVRQGELVDVTWTMTTTGRERDMLPIRIPLTRGLLGYRLLVIREADLPRFAGVDGHQALQTLVAGQGVDWPDTEILRANQLPVMAGRNSPSLFEMLRRERFDYFPRGVVEAWSEMEGGQGGEDLLIEPHLLIHYPAAVYFFVNRHAAALAQRIEQGLRRALADGTFDKHFREAHQAAIDAGHLATRRVVWLQNPMLPPETPLHEPGLWFSGIRKPAPVTSRP